MPTKLLLPLFALAVLLSACSNTVINEEDRELPEQPPVAAEDSSLGSTEHSSSQLSIVPIEEEEDEAATAEYTANLAESFIAFTGTKGPIEQECTFNTFDVLLKTESGEPVSLDVDIDLSSMESGSQKLTEHLLNPDFFDAEKWPNATFTATSFVKGDGNTYAVTGTLSMHGVSHPEIIQMDITNSHIIAHHILDRTVYGIGAPAEGLMAVDAPVTLEIKVVFN